MNDKITLKLGTRGSPLAMWQAKRVQSLLHENCPEIQVDIVEIQTSGDKILDKPLVQIGGKGIFTKEIEQALMDKEIDFAVHSFKDLPTVLPEGLEIVCIPERDNPFDALFSNGSSTLSDLPENPTLATGSLRRKAQILALRPDAKVVDIRGNVNTRLHKYFESNWDGLIMAMAGIRRMGWEEQIAGILQPEEMLPAPAQGALAIEARSQDLTSREILHRIHDEKTAAGILAERSFLAVLEGGCQVPMAAYAEQINSTLRLHGLVASLDGRQCIRHLQEGDTNDPETLGREVAEKILTDGGEEIIQALKENEEKK